ncbi:rab11 family-interacting protein 3-like isoform X2 [Pomacea canaliculata]|uniref:rab11 family-interacting protein 3-like isoform X2 n=1 Tax=Pomacea canaliculata TaxID=400727 RepID=UPI000D739D50|nr:rab11 family-interacting protein 3-like isoform X2 [Pomacea canaliculata]
MWLAETNSRELRKRLSVGLGREAAVHLHISVEITGVVNLLDPEGRRHISFEDFCKGVAQINEVQHQAQFLGFKSSVSEDTLVPQDIAGDLSGLPKRSLSPSTYVDYDFDGLEESCGSNDDINLLKCEKVVTCTANKSFLLPPTSEDEGDSALSGRSSELNENSRPEITDEENYEDYGEMESEADISDQGISNRRLMPSSYMSQLQQSPRDFTRNNTRRNSIGSDEIFDDIDGNFQDLNGRVKYLESQLLHLMDTQNETTTKQSRLREENSLLIQKVINLEEQLKDMEMRSEECVKEEKHKHQEYMSRHDREKCEEMEYVTQRLQRIESEYEDMKEKMPTLQQQILKLRSENIVLQERILEKQESYNMLHDDYEHLKASYHHQEELHHKESQFTKQLLDELGKELEDMRKYRTEMELGSNASSGSKAESPGHYRELQQEIYKLKKENQGLRDSNEDLNAQLMSHCVEEGKSLLKSGNGKSLAEELEHLTKEELLEQLHAERDFSSRLKQYVDRIIITILEKNPSLLEIKAEKCQEKQKHSAATNSLKNHL